MTSALNAELQPPGDLVKLVCPPDSEVRTQKDLRKNAFVVAGWM